MRAILLTLAKWCERLRHRNVDWPCICEGGTSCAKKYPYQALYQCNNCLGYATLWKWLKGGRL